MDKNLIFRLHQRTGQSMKDCKDVLKTMEETLAVRYVEHYEELALKRFIDPVELDKKYGEVVNSVDIEVNEFVESFYREKGLSSRRGLCHIGWKRKAEILNDRYNIIWKSPAKMNKNVTYD